MENTILNQGILFQVIFVIY